MHGHMKLHVRITGIEPISSVWKTENLPLIYIRICLKERFEMHMCVKRKSVLAHAYGTCTSRDAHVCQAKECFSTCTCFCHRSLCTYQRQHVEHVWEKRNTCICALASPSLHSKNGGTPPRLWRGDEGCALHEERACFRFEKCFETSCLYILGIGRYIWYWKKRSVRLSVRMGGKSGLCLGCERITCEIALRESVTAPYLAWNVCDACISSIKPHLQQNI